jgi:hypothetical protein
MAPCDTNKITVTLQINVPVSNSTEITIAGLVGAQTNSTAALQLDGQDPVTPCFRSTAKWDQTTGTMILQVQANTTMPAHTECSFNFQLANPAGHLVGVSPAITAKVCVDCPVINNVMEGTAMKVSPLNFDSYIWQSSPFPADENTITVSLIHHDPTCTGVLDDRCSARHKKVPLYDICNPEVTISGLTNAVHDDGLIMLKNEFNGVSVNGTWSSSGFSVKAKLGLLIGSLSRASVFHFSFQVINPNFGQAAQSVTLDASLLDTRNPEAERVIMATSPPNAGSQSMDTPHVSLSVVDLRG